MALVAIFHLLTHLAIAMPKPTNYHENTIYEDDNEENDNVELVPKWLPDSDYVEAIARSLRASDLQTQYQGTL